MSAVPAISGSTHRFDLQGLRGLAVMLVFLAHAGISWFEGGFIGVDVFFVLSGFLITGILLRSHDSGTLKLIEFYARRLRRLLPALVLMVLVVYLLGSIMLLPGEAESKLQSTPFALLWISNLFFAAREIDYFDEFMDRDLFLHTWSLGVEEQFYLLWPLIILLAAWWGKRRGRSLVAAATQAFLIVIVLSFSLCYFLSQVAIDWAFYGMPARAWQFAVGGLIACGVHSGRLATMLNEDRSRLAVLIVCFGLLFILGSAMLLGVRSVYPGMIAIAPTLGAAAVIIGGCSLRGHDLSLLNNRLMVWLGDRSYSIYLWHWPVLMLAEATSTQQDSANLGVLLLLVLLLAHASYHWIELPAWKGRFSRMPARASILTAFFGMGLSILVIQNLGVNSPNFQRASNGFVPLVTEARHHLSSFTSDMPDFYKYGRNCDTYYRSPALVPCSLTNDGERHAVVMGDSIALHWIGAIEEILGHRGWRITVLTKSACPMVSHTIWNPRLNDWFTVCDKWKENALDWLAGKEIDLLVIGNSSGYALDQVDWVESYRQFINHVVGLTDKLIVLQPTPSLAENGIGCLLRHHRSVGSVDENSCTSPLEPLPAQHGAMLTEAIASLDQVWLLDLSELPCPAGTCHAWLDGIPVYRDRNHLTDTFVRSRADEVEVRLRELDDRIDELLGP